MNEPATSPTPDLSAGPAVIPDSSAALTSTAAPVPTQGPHPPADLSAPSNIALGKIRGTGMCIFLAVITFGIYQMVWWYSTHEEMKRHTGQGLGGGLALLLAFFVGIVMPYINSSEVGSMYERAGMPKPVSGTTGLWFFPGIFILVGPLVWFIKTNGALNAYWRAQGVR